LIALSNHPSLAGTAAGTSTAVVGVWNCSACTDATVVGAADGHTEEISTGVTASSFFSDTPIGIHSGIHG
jgi:hypothetical protein